MLRQPNPLEKTSIYSLKRGFLFPEAHDIPKSLMTDLLYQGHTSQRSCLLLPGPKPTTQTNQPTNQHTTKAQDPHLEISPLALKEKPREHGKWDCAVFSGSMKNFETRCSIGKLFSHGRWHTLEAWAQCSFFPFPYDVLRSGLDEKEGGGTVPPRYLAALLFLARTGPIPTPPPHTSLVLELCQQAEGLKVVTIKAEESYRGGCGYPTVILLVL